MQRVAVVGAGVSGLVVAYLLHRMCDITVFEAGHEPGGHVHTVDVELAGQQWSIDTGFIVYNEQNYPRFTHLLRQLGVATQPTSMSFSVSGRNPHFEYNGSSLNQIFAQRKNLFRPRFYRMLRDIFRFNQDAPVWIDQAASTNATVGELATQQRYSKEFVQQYLIPLGSALWSASPGSVLDMPARFFVKFLENHGMLTMGHRPQWRVITGGSSQYVQALTQLFADRIRLNHRVHQVRRLPSHVDVDGEAFDRVVLACHSDQALEIIQDPTDAEREILAAIPYQVNELDLHTDVRVLPRRRRAWAAWNYHLDADPASPVSVTYNMNILQGLSAPEQLCVTLNDHGRIDRAKVLYRTRFAHPQFSLSGAVAQQRRDEISGVNNTYYCGAYWGNGFHEDGVTSALHVYERFGGAL